MTALSLEKLPRLWRTVRHLRPSQVGWRLRYLLERKLESQAWYDVRGRAERRIDAAHATVLRPHFRPVVLPTRSALNRLAELIAGRLTLLNEQREFVGGSDWNRSDDPRRKRLWNFTLHYHSWLCDLAVDYAHTKNPAYLIELRKWLVDWMEHCPLGAPGFAQTPWNSFNIGERLWQWRQIDVLVPKSFWHDVDLPRERFLHSLAMQAEYLSRHLEWDLRGNHLFKDAVGLAVAAEMYGGAAGARWRQQAVELTIDQLDEQILPDGMHFERSPMYHIHVLEDLLALQTLLLDQRVQDALTDSLRRMAEPLRWLKHPCGRYPLLNDAADHQVSRPDEMLSELQRRGLISQPQSTFGLKFLEHAGLVAWQGTPWTVFFDVGAIGPAYQPGHAHADSLSVELSFDGLPFVVDPGTVCYDDDERRHYDRSTAAHNTVVIDDCDSSEVWHIFRVGRRAEPRDVSVIDREYGFIAAASHTGYEHLAGSPRHHRVVQVGAADLLEIHDEITGSESHHASGGFLLAPGWDAVITTTGWKLHHRHCRMLVELRANQPVQCEVVTRPWHPEFGREVTTQRLVWSGDITPPFRVTTTWQRG